MPDAGEFARSSPLAILAAVGPAGLGQSKAVYRGLSRESVRHRTENIQERIMAATLDNGITTIMSHHSVDQTVKRP